MGGGGGGGGGGGRGGVRGGVRWGGRGGVRGRGVSELFFERIQTGGGMGGGARVNDFLLKRI